MRKACHECTKRRDFSAGPPAQPSLRDRVKLQSRFDPFCPRAPAVEASGMTNTAARNDATFVWHYTAGRLAFKATACKADVQIFDIERGNASHCADNQPTPLCFTACTSNEEAPASAGVLRIKASFAKRRVFIQRSDDSIRCIDQLVRLCGR